jgi:multisubunit Na+/H+ antiporter MnhC subunit
LDAVGIRLALARYRSANAIPVATFVSYSAWISVVAVRLVGNEIAASCTITSIVSTGVIVVADHRRAHTLTHLTVIASGAGIVIFAFARIEGLVGAAILSLAEVLGTFDSVVAQRHGHTAFVRGLINVPVAVVVDAVAILHGGSGRVTVR